MSLHFTKDHEWIRVEGDTATVGITDHAQGQLGDIVFAEAPEAGRTLDKGGEAAVVESVKAASDIAAPIAGVITAVNTALADAPGQVNDDAMAAWFFRIKPAQGTDLGGFMDEDAYQALIG